MISIDELTAPLAQNDPCGEDLAMGPGLIELETLLRGTPERQFSTAEPPDWRKLRDACLELFGRSRDLRVSVTLCLALTCTDGLAGLRQGLAVLRLLLEKHWDGVHPKLDPEDNNDPLQRMNTLAVLGAPVGKDGDEYKFIERLQGIPLTNSRQMGRFTFGALLEARQSTGGETAGRPDPAQIDAAFKDTPQEELQATLDNANGAITELRGMTELLRSKVGPVNAPNLSELEKALLSLASLVAPHVVSAAPVTTAEPPGKNGNGASAGNGVAAISSREDVLRALRLIRTFYAEHEPSSPIPLLVQRVERMVPMNFVELLKDMAPDALSQVSTIVGPLPETES